MLVQVSRRFKDTPEAFEARKYLERKTGGPVPDEEKLPYLVEADSLEDVVNRFPMDRNIYHYFICQPKSKPLADVLAAEERNKKMQEIRDLMLMDREGNVDRATAVDSEDE